MSENNEEVKTEVVEEKEQISLSKEEYANMLKEVTSVKAQLAALQELRSPQQMEEDIEEEERPSRRQKESIEGEPDYSAMSPKEFMEHILSTVQENIAKPLLVAVMTNQVRQEIKETKAKYNDFTEFEKDVEKVCRKNPNLSVEDAYLMVKGKREGTNIQKKEEPQAKVDLKKVGGEKPTVSSTALKQGSPKTIQDAARLAAEQVLEGKGE